MAGDTIITIVGNLTADPEMRLIGVIIAALDAGATRQAVCTQLGIARTTLNRWIAEP